MARMIKRFTLDENDFSIDSLVKINNPEIIYEIVNGIFSGIAKGLEKVDIFEIMTNSDFDVFSVDRKNWIKALKKCMESLIEMEDYETCAEIKKSISILER